VNYSGLVDLFHEQPIDPTHIIKTVSINVKVIIQEDEVSRRRSIKDFLWSSIGRVDSIYGATQIKPGKPVRPFG
jgi:hypothetical protein